MYSDDVWLYLSGKDSNSNPSGTTQVSLYMCVCVWFDKDKKASLFMILKLKKGLIFMKGKRWILVMPSSRPLSVLVNRHANCNCYIHRIDCRKFPYCFITLAHKYPNVSLTLQNHQQLLPMQYQCNYHIFLRQSTSI